MWNLKGLSTLFLTKLNFSLKENVKMASKKAVANENTKVTKKNFFQRSTSAAPANIEKSVADSESMDSKSNDFDSKKVIRRSSMICSEGFDKYTFDCHRADILSKSSGLDRNASLSSEVHPNSVTSSNSSVASTKLSKATSDPSVKKAPFFKPVTVPSLSGKMTSLPFKKVPDQTIPSVVTPSYKRVPEETIPYVQHPYNIPDRSLITNIPLSFNPIPEETSWIADSSAVNNTNKSPIPKSSPFTFKHISEEMPVRNSALTFKSLPEEKLVNKSFPSKGMPVQSGATKSVPSKLTQNKLSLGRNTPLSFPHESKTVLSDNQPYQTVSDESIPVRTKPLSLINVPRQNASERQTSMLAHTSARQSSFGKNIPLSAQTVYEEPVKERNSSQSLSNIQDEPIPVRNSPLSLKPILTKHISLLKKKNSSTKGNAIKRDSIVHPDNVDMQSSLCINGRFQNPWPTWRPPTFTNILKFGVTRNNSKVPPNQELDLILPIVKQNLAKLTVSDDIIRVTWIGHSTLLVQMHGLNILTDPIFSDRASPSQVVGPKRYRDPPCTIHDLPHINAVMISHSHYDHLDYNTVTLLNARFGSDIRWFVPLGLKTWMEDVGCENVVELDWWEENCVPEHSDTFFIFTPAQHWSKRTIGDDNKVLWGSWCVIGPKYKFFFAGDTGYCEVFKQIGRVHGPFDLSAIPIGAYEPRWFMKYQHINPEEAVKIHMDIKSKRSVAIHWGTFSLANEYYLDPPVKLREGLDKYEISPDQFFTMKHGESRIIAQNNLVKCHSLNHDNVKSS